MTTNTIHPALAGFHPPVQAWFSEAFTAPTRPQRLGWPAIQSGQSTLILAPTGTGKTLAAFLVAIDRLMFSPVLPVQERCRVLYISPLKALAVDVERNLLPAPPVFLCLQADSNLRCVGFLHIILSGFCRGSHETRTDITTEGRRPHR